MTKAYMEAPAAEGTTRLMQAGVFAWRILIVALGYMLTSWVGGVILGRALDAGSSAISLFLGVLTGATLGLIAARLRAARASQWVAWVSVLFLNMLSLAIEGAFYAPGQSPMGKMPLPWTAYVLFQSVVIGGLIAWLWGQQRPGGAGAEARRERAWHSWAWRFAVSSLSYLLFYFIFGAANYALVTKPYYAAHVSGLAVPAPQAVLVAELVRAPMIVLSIVPLILLWQGKRGTLAVLCGVILFVGGGVIPLVTNTALPNLLRFASAIEIFFQNFLTGVVAAVLLGSAGAASTQSTNQAREK